MFSSSSCSPSNSSCGDDSHDSDAIEGIEAVEAPADDSDAIETPVVLFHFDLKKKTRWDGSRFYATTQG